MIISLTLGSFIACGDKEEDTGVVTDTATTEETDTEDTSDTEETDTEDTEDTSDTEDEVVDADGDGVPASEDCDDSNADMPANDADCDGALTADDCDDNDATRYPGAEEIADDGIDQNCSTLELHLDTSCSSGTAVRLTGPWWGWDAAAGPEATDADGDGVFTVMFEEPPAEPMEYKWIVDGEFEADLMNAGFCADMTNPSGGFANRIWMPGDGNTVEYPGTCFECGQTDWTSQQPVTIELHTDATATGAHITGPWWGWDPAGGPEAVKIADGHFQFSFDPAPGENMEFLFVVDGVVEGLISAYDGANVGPTCRAINTDYANYFNRYWLAGSGDQEYVFNTCDAPAAE
jgi:hypothetical protein